MLRASFSSPGYHTTLTGGTVHRTRNSLEYAVALLDAGDPNRAERAEQILDRVIGLQDQNPASRTYGIWSWFLEEPLNQMSPPDWNWADFCGTQLLQVAIDHKGRIDAMLHDRVKESILHAARAIVKRNVGPGYTNIALMGTYVTLVAGERFGVPELTDYGKKRLRRFYEYTQEKGSFTEYNSPTYTLVAIEEISRMRAHVRDAESRRLLDELNDFAWRHVARRFHPPTRQWAGPHSRSYSTLLRSSALAFIQRGTAGKVQFVPEDQAWESIDAHRIPLECPEALHRTFTELVQARLEAEVFVYNPQGQHDIIGTTVLHPDFTLASINVGDLWNQRRPLIAYWSTTAGPAALSLRCLHDGYDYSSASLFAIQDEADILGAVLFATDRGDTHISLDRLKNATIKARDMRVRLQFEGELGALELPGDASIGEPVEFTSGRAKGKFCVHAAAFDEVPIRMETGRDAETAWIDVVLYPGPGRDFDFSRIGQAGVVFTLSMTSTRIPATIPDPTVLRGTGGSILVEGRIISGRHTYLYRRGGKQNLELTAPLAPLPTNTQRKATTARRGLANPWKTGPLYTQ
jgi:hypothetical protein